MADLTKLLASLDDLPAPINLGGYLTTDEVALNAAVEVGISQQARIAELEDLIGRYANSVANANGVYFEPSGPDGEYIIGMAERASARAALGDGA